MAAFDDIFGLGGGSAFENIFGKTPQPPKPTSTLKVPLRVKTIEGAKYVRVEDIVAAMEQAEATKNARIITALRKVLDG